MVNVSCRVTTLEERRTKAGTKLLSTHAFKSLAAEISKAEPKLMELHETYIGYPHGTHVTPTTVTELPSCDLGFNLDFSAIHRGNLRYFIGF